MQVGSSGFLKQDSKKVTHAGFGMSLIATSFLVLEVKKLVLNLEKIKEEKQI